MSSSVTEPLSARERGVRYVGLALFILLGVVVGGAGLLVHGGWFPGGVLLALAALAGSCVAGRRVLGGRSGAFAPAVGWALVVMPLTFWTTPEGDFLSTDVMAALFLYGGVFVVVICATMLGSTRSGIGGREDQARRPQ